MNTIEIIDIAMQLKSVSEGIGAIAASMSNTSLGDDIREKYEYFIQDEVTHAQIMVLELTRLVTEQEENNDEAFGPGELDSVVGKKQEEPECK